MDWDTINKLTDMFERAVQIRQKYQYREDVQAIVQLIGDTLKNEIDSRTEQAE